MTDIIFIKTEEELNYFKNLKPKAKYNRTKFKIKCSICGNEDVKNLQAILYPFICHKCNLSSAHKTEKYKNNYKNTMISLYGTCNYNNRELAKKTCMERYGGIGNAVKEQYEKQKQTMLEKYGVEFPCQNKGIYEKVKQTKYERYGDSNFNNREKSIKTCNEKYGVNSAMQLQDIQDKVAKTKFEHYGSCTYNNRSAAAQTCIKKYGVPHQMQAKEVVDKIHSKYIYDNLKFDSSWELAYYIWLIENNINFEYQPAIKFEYEYNNKIHYYNPDFLVNGELQEIKGLQFFENKDSNGKLINPFDRTQDGLYEAKQKCMQLHNVKILTDCDFAIDYVNKKYTADYLSLFKNNIPFPYLNKDLHDKSDMGLIHHFHKSIYEATRKGKISPLNAWNDKNVVKKVALNRLKYVGRCKPSDILQGFNVTRIANKISVFKPALAQRLIRKYLNDSEIMFDPFSGFSGRMLGAFNCGKRYFGYDINEDHVNESNQIIDYKMIGNMCSVKIEDLLTAAEKDYTHLKNTALFTCPPYGGKEHWNKNNDEVEMSCDEWIDLCIDKYKVDKYLFVVDKTEKYKNNIVETITNKSHFGENTEKIILIDLSLGMMENWQN